LTDIQEYYANTGGLKRAAEKQRGKKVNTSFVFSKDTTPQPGRLAADGVSHKVAQPNGLLRWRIKVRVEPLKSPNA